MNENLLAYLAAYLIGAIPCGLILARIFAGVDISKEGSHSIGATNVLRVVKSQNPKLAKTLSIATIVCDALKGLLPIIVGGFLNLSVETLWAMAVLAVLGHCFSPYLFFDGGKGIATGAAVLIYFMPIAICGALLVWFIVGRVFKKSSLASLFALVAMVAFSFIFYADIAVIHTHAPIFMIGFIVLYKHIPNIIRLVNGSEAKVI